MVLVVDAVFRIKEWHMLSSPACARFWETIHFGLNQLAERMDHPATALVSLRRDYTKLYYCHKHDTTPHQIPQVLHFR